MRLPSELEEFLAAALASACVAVATAGVYRLVTGQTPGPGLVLGLIVGFGWGAALLALTSPRRRD